MYYLKESNYIAKCAICNGTFPKAKTAPPGRKAKSLPENDASDVNMIMCSNCDLKGLFKKYVFLFETNSKYLNSSRHLSFDER